MFIKEIFPLYLLIIHLTTVCCREVNFEVEGGVPDDLANEIAWVNGNLLNKTLASLVPGEDVGGPDLDNFVFQETCSLSPTKRSW